jgi:hypothetical protein
MTKPMTSADYDPYFENTNDNCGLIKQPLSKSALWYQNANINHNNTNPSNPTITTVNPFIIYPQFRAQLSILDTVLFEMRNVNTMTCQDHFSATGSEVTSSPFFRL